MAIFAIDFDGTIVEHKFPEIGKLKANCKYVLKKLKENGHKIIIWTCRCDDEHGPYKSIMKNFLDKNDISYDVINENLCKDFTPIPKIYYDVCIDDRNLFIPLPVNWLDIELKLIELGYIK